MRRETAYKLAGRKHDHPIGGTGLIKEREIRFATYPPGQKDHAFRSLRALKGLSVHEGEGEYSLTVAYSVLEYSLESLEDALQDAGFHLDSSLFIKLRRALVYFCEETQRHNLLSPERLLKKSNEAYITAYDQHQHGDHDDTPPELREYK